MSFAFAWTQCTTNASSTDPTCVQEMLITPSEESYAFSATGVVGVLVTVECRFRTLLSRDNAVGGYDSAPAAARAIRVVICGSFRRDIASLMEVHEALRDIGCEVLSPRTARPHRERQGFVFMAGESWFSPEAIEANHLNSIVASDFVWLHCPDGYVGPTATAEVAFAVSSAVPVYASTPPVNALLRPLVVADIALGKLVEAHIAVRRQLKVETFLQRRSYELAVMRSDSVDHVLDPLISRSRVLRSDVAASNDNAVTRCSDLCAPLSRDLQRSGYTSVVRKIGGCR